MQSWIPASSIQSGELHRFPAGTVVIQSPLERQGAVALAIRVDVPGPALYQLSPTNDWAIGHVTGLDLHLVETGFGIRVAGAAIQIELDLAGSTIEPAPSTQPVGCLALGAGGVRLVGVASGRHSALYIDPVDWRMRHFGDGNDASIMALGWRVVLPLGPERRVVLFDAPRRPRPDHSKGLAI